MAINTTFVELTQTDTNIPIGFTVNDNNMHFRNNLSKKGSVFNSGKGFQAFEVYENYAVLKKLFSDLNQLELTMNNGVAICFIINGENISFQKNYEKGEGSLFWDGINNGKPWEVTESYAEIKKKVLKFTEQKN